MNITIKRAYEKPLAEDGTRVLVDRLWPRGISKQKAMINAWCKEIAPSKELRQWFDHRDDRFAVFKKRYIAELENNPATQALLDYVSEHLSEGNVTLVYGAKNTNCNQAVVLKEYLEEKLWKQPM